MEHKPPPSSRLLGEYLDCSQEQIEHALSLQSTLPEGEQRRRLGDLLLETGAIDLSSLLKAVELQRVDRLKACLLFAGLSVADLKELAAVFQEVSVPAGIQFITQDIQDPYVYVLANGTCKVFRSDEANKEIPLARLFAGEPVGEMGYFGYAKRSASVRALDRVELLRASYEDLTDCFETVPSVAGAFMQVVTERLGKTQTLYQENEPKGPEGPALEHLSGFFEWPCAQQLEEGVDRLLVRMVHATSRLMDADRGSLFLIDHKTGELWSKVAEGSECKEIRVPANSGIVGWSVQHKELVNVAEAYEDDRFNGDVDENSGYRTRTVLCTPLRGSGGRALGAVEVINKRIGLFNEDDENLLRAFAAQAAMAVENINLFREVVRGYRRMAVLLDVATAVAASKKLADLIVRVADRLRPLMRCDLARLYVFLPETAELLTAWKQENGEIEEERFDMTGSLAGEVMRSRQKINVADVYEDERLNPEAQGRGVSQARCMLLCPVAGPDGNPVGVVEVINRTDGVFNEEDEEILCAIGSQIGVSALFSG